MSLRAVLDTNVFIAALLFEGELSQLVSLWQKRLFVYLLTRSILDEYIRVLSYPKFDLIEREIKALIEEDLLPYVEVIQEKNVSVPRLNDRDDEKFLRAAILGNADRLVTGDHELLELKKVKRCQIVTPNEFLKLLAPK